jgi:hypothetical protein
MELLTITVKEVIVRFVDTGGTVMVNNSTSINKTNNHLFNSDGQQIHQYQQNEQSPPNSDGQQFHQYQQNEQSPL